MRTAVEAFRIALPANDVASSAHRSRNDPEIAFARANRALACYEDVLAEMVLPRDIVVVAIDGFYLGLDCFTAKRPIDGFHRGAEHDLPVRQREVLRPPHRLDVIVKVAHALWQIGEIGIRQIDEPPAHMLIGAADEV